LRTQQELKWHELNARIALRTNLHARVTATAGGETQLFQGVELRNESQGVTRPIVIARRERQLLPVRALFHDGGHVF
jgi:hypothetical protein